jgi:hypothetical protein
MMNDFAQTLAAKSDQINNADLSGRSQTITITRVVVKLADAQQVSISFQGSEKVYRPSKGMRRLMAQIWGEDPSVYIGRSLTLYRDADVNFGADTTGGTRISHMSHIDGQKKATVPLSRVKVKQYTINPIATPTAQTRQEPPINALDLAKAAAGGGTASFREWWASDIGKLCRPIIEPDMNDLKRIAAEADGPRNDEPPM